MSCPATAVLQPWQASEFESLLRACLDDNTANRGQVATFAETGCTHSRYGLRLTLPTSAEVYLQIVAARPPDARAEQQGAPPPRLRAAALPAVGKTPLAAVERHLIGVLTARRDPFIRRVEPLSAANGAIPYGLHVTFHCGAAVCCYVAYLVPAGYSRPLGGPYPALHQV
ncbi:hypothetical protein [Streptomyces sp. NPDC048659]|uniref:hypothetical protein n=1 Tax=Streptomyces sp. NPDC048659 TaxID=3155489 RepID=UPI0034317D50